jgi:hypothetical protein
VTIHDGSRVQVFLPHEIVQKFIPSDELVDWCFSVEDLQSSDDGFARELKQWARHHDVGLPEDVLPRVVVAGIHADAVQYTSSLRAGSGRSLLVCSMNILSGKDDRARARRFPLFVLGKHRQCKCGCGGFCTTQHLFDAIGWSFEVMRDGIAPAVGHTGARFSEVELQARITPGDPVHRGCLMNIRGDWEGLATFFRLRWFTQKQFCFLCNASLDDGPLSYKDFSDAAGHRSTLFSHVDYMEGCAAAAASPCAIFRAPGLTLHSLCIDSMHSADLGCFADAIGSLFHLEVHSKEWHSTIAQGLAALNDELRCFYQANKALKLSSVYPLVESQLKSASGFPFLRAKAAECRHLSEYGLMLAKVHKYGVPGVREPFRFEVGHRLEDKTREHVDDQVEVFEGMCQYLRAVSQDEFNANDCKAGLMRFLRALGRLEHLWHSGLSHREQAKEPYHLRQKAHLLEHLALDQIDRYGNPSRWWCYRDESFVGSVKRVASKTKAPATLEVRIMQKLRMLEALGHEL